MSSSNDFQQIVDKSHETPVVIQFFANWCGPCRILKPVMSQLESNSDGKWIFLPVDVEEYSHIASMFNVRTIPAVFLIHEGKSIASFKGSKSSHVVQNWLDNNLPKNGNEEVSDIENLLKNEDIDAVKLGLLNVLDEKYPKSDVVKLLIALQNIGTNNPESLQQINKIDRKGGWGNLAKQIRDLIELDVDEKDTSTPSSSPFNPSSKSVEERIDLNNFDISLLERLVHDLINEVRFKKGVGGLIENSILTSAAKNQNDYQIKNDILSHYQNSGNKKTVMDRVNSFGGGFRGVGENVQYQGMQVRRWSTGKTEIITDTYINTAKKLVDNWVNSPGHYKNLISSKFNLVGTSVGWNVENNSIFATQVFGTK